LEWMQKSADHGYAPAEFNLGSAYLNGEMGLEKNQQKALEWMQKSADHGYEDAGLIVGMYYIPSKYGWVTGKDVSVNENIKLAYDYLKMASKSSNQETSKSANNLIKKIETEPAFIALKNSENSNKIVSSVSDPETGKYGGPDTAVVVKFVTGQGQDNSYSNMMSGMTAQLGQLTGVKYKQIKRGAPLKSLGPTIPVGTTLYPIRIVIEVHDMEQSTDYYFYKDEFGDWKASLK